MINGFNWGASGITQTLHLWDRELYVCFVKGHYHSYINYNKYQKDDCSRQKIKQILILRHRHSMPPKNQKRSCKSKGTMPPKLSKSSRTYSRYTTGNRTDDRTSHEAAKQPGSTGTEVRYARQQKHWARFLRLKL